MSHDRILTFAFMEPPFESERTVTFFRHLFLPSLFFLSQPLDLFR